MQAYTTVESDTYSSNLEDLMSLLVQLHDKISNSARTPVSTYVHETCFHFPPQCKINERMHVRRTATHFYYRAN